MIIIQFQFAEVVLWCTILYAAGLISAEALAQYLVGVVHDDKCVRVYLLHPLFQVDDLILAWDSSVADLSVSSVPAEKQISTEYYSGQRFTALCDTAAKIDYVIKTESRYSKVYAFTTLFVERYRHGGKAAERRLLLQCCTEIRQFGKRC